LLDGNEWKYLKECLDTGWVSSVGPFVERFEREVACHVGARHAVATASGTAALHVALQVAGVQPDDEVLVSTLSFIAPANAVRYLGARPVFMDADPQYWQMDPEKVRTFLDQECLWRNGTLYNKSSNRRVKAILPVHILGHPCDLDPLFEVARQYDLVVVEDAAECLGAKYKGRKIGQVGLVCFSFNGNKLITTGGGGMIVTDNEAWARKAKYLTTQAKDDEIGYVHHEIGYNYRLTNLQAAVGCAQMERLEVYLALKHRIAERYREGLREIQGITPMPEAPWATSTFWMYTALVDEGRFGTDRKALLPHFQKHGVQSRPLWQPLHCSPAHAGSQAYHCETAERLHREALSLPASVSLSGADQQRVIETLKEAPRACRVA